MIIFIILWYILIALVPGIFWIWFYRKEDRKNPEPRNLIIKVFLWGMAITIPAVAFEFAADFFIPFTTSEKLYIIFFASLFIIAPIEEYFKYFVIKRWVYTNPAFDEPLDGIIYGVVAGLGFASLENILVIFSEGQSAIVLRFATATLMHAITSGIVGYYLGIAKFTKGKENNSAGPAREKSLISRGLIIAILLHGLYNIIVSIQTVLALILTVLFLIIIYSILASKIRQIKELKSSS
jgi:RsiW-degrading membrane proteinase PrsW (M82 family)